MSYIDSVGSFISGGDGDIRVMSYNLLVDSDDYDWGTPLGERPTGAVECLRHYSPDVVGLQEASTGWFAAFRELLYGEYEFFNPDFNDRKDYVNTALIYNVRKVRPIAGEVVVYSVSNCERMRLVNVGVFERIADGRRFAVSSTHLDSDYPGDRTPERLIQIGELIETAKRYKTGYGCSFISTGDMNITPDKPEYRAFTENDVFADADEAPLSDIVDHIFHTGGVRSLHAVVVDDENARGASDHLPLFADFAFGER